MNYSDRKGFITDPQPPVLTMPGQNDSSLFSAANENITDFAGALSTTAPTTNRTFVQTDQLVRNIHGCRVCRQAAFTVCVRNYCY